MRVDGIEDGRGDQEIEAVLDEVMKPHRDETEHRSDPDERPEEQRADRNGDQFELSRSAPAIREDADREQNAGTDPGDEDHGEKHQRTLDGPLFDPECRPLGDHGVVRTWISGVKKLLPSERGRFELRTRRHMCSDRVGPTMSLRAAVAVGCCFFLLAGVGSFVVSPADSTPEPVDFDRTVGMGLTLEEQRALGEDRLVPRVQVAYSQFPYVVGYRGIGLAASEIDDPTVERQFGYPQAIYVEATPADVSLDGSGTPVGRHTGEWIPVATAHFVVGSDARISADPTPIPFAEHDDAARFASSYGGDVVGWDERDRFDVSQSDGESARDRIDTQQRTAETTVSGAETMLDRPVETVVGEDGATLRTALEGAEPNTTIHLPAGTYEGPIEIDESVTLRGTNATIVGGGNGTVLTVTADHVAVAGVSVTGVGDSLRADNRSHGSDREEWDRHTEEAYGYADAGITAAGVDRLLVSDVEVETPASGIILRDTERAVVDRVRVDGTDEWEAGFMGVTAIRSPAVVQRSTFEGGRDGVYTHRASGIVVRDNRFIGGRFGTHLMYTSDALVAGNCASGQALSGVVIMTSPSGVAIADNVITDTEQGISTSGSDAYIGDNVVVGTSQAIRTSARNSLYADNTVVDNRVGFRASSVFPTSVVVRNDIADNERPVRATSGPLRVWSHDGEGNYWDGATGLDRPYSPTDPVDGRLHRAGSARTLADAPVVRGLRTLRGSVPGMRGESVVDTHPRETPVNATRLETARAIADGDTPPKAGCHP